MPPVSLSELGRIGQINDVQVDVQLTSGEGGRGTTRGIREDRNEVRRRRSGADGGGRRNAGQHASRQHRLSGDEVVRGGRGANLDGEGSRAGKGSRDVHQRIVENILRRQRTQRQRDGIGRTGTESDIGVLDVELVREAASLLLKRKLRSAGAGDGDSSISHGSDLLWLRVSSSRRTCRGREDS
ncbi:MAG: hypothetical protein EBY66_05095 [Candidatus Fonsibacter lacus]|nr:hypothetical protein [Candidatus Fonsibacter lacus]